MSRSANQAAPVSLAPLRRYAVYNTLFRPTTLSKAIEKLGFVQADPIRAPARAQDLILRHRVKNYRAGDLEAKYARLDIEEDFFINHGFVPRRVHALMHPRTYGGTRATLIRKYGASVMDYIAKHGVVHPRDVDQHFAHGSVVNGWGGQSSLTTHLLDGMHYRGMLRIAGREKGIRLYAMPKTVHESRAASEIDIAIDALLDVLVAKYAPIPATSLGSLLGRLRYGVPQWHSRLPAAIKRAKQRLVSANVDGVTWYWPAGVDIFSAKHDVDDEVRLLAPFDPIVWDRKRFEILWRWAYRFEAYTPAPKRKLGYYALPMLWRDEVIGWANVSATDGVMQPSFGYVKGRPPREVAFRRALSAEIERMETFLR